MNNKCEPYIIALRIISRILDNLKYECSGRVYELTDEEMAKIFCCRDVADAMLHSKEEEES